MKRGQKLNPADMVGIINGNMQVLSVDDVVHVGEGAKGHWKYIITIKCLNCGETYKTTWTNFRATSRSNSKGCIKCFGKIMQDETTKKTGLTKWERLRLATIKSGAKHRNICFDLTDEEVKRLINSPCTYCGREKACGIDRIDSTKGYATDNVCPCCEICNKMKNDYSLEFFKDHVISMYKHMIENEN